MSLNRKVKDMDTKESRREELMGMCLEGGYLNEEILDQINSIDRFAPILIRCGGGRLICSAQDVKHFIEIISNEGSDYVRDVSLHLHD